MKKAGGKLTTKHTTVIDAAGDIVDFAQGHPLVTKISLGLIKPLRSSGGVKRIKVIEEDACFLITIRGNTAMQELRIYSQDKETLKKDLFRFSKQNGFTL